MAVLATDSINLDFHDVTLDPVSTVVFRGRKPVHSSGYHTDSEISAALCRLDAAPDRRFAGRSVFMGINKFNNYYHWMAEMLPAIAGYQVHPDFAKGILLLTAEPSLTDVMCRSIELATAGRQRAFAQSADRRPLALDHLVYSRFIHSAAEELGVPGALYDHMVQQICPQPGPPHRRLYVSRIDAQRSPMANAAALQDLLADYGVETIVPGAFDLATQIATFQSAQWIIGAHGAGLTNIVFAQPGAWLYELFPSVSVRNTCYARMAHARGVHYAADVFAAPSPTQPGLVGLRQTKWHVDLDVVARRLQAMAADEIVTR